MLRALGRHTSYNVQKVLWTLDELGVDYEHTNLGGPYGGLDTPEFGALNPNHKVPVLDDDGVVIWESHAILRYLAAKYGCGTLWPEDPAERSHADRWIDWAQAQLLPAFIGLFWGYYRTPAPDRDAAANKRLQRQCERAFDLLDTQLANRPFLAGQTFTMGDIPAGTSLYRYFEMGLDVKRPHNVIAWYERLQQRQPFRGNIMDPFDELFGRLNY